MPQIRMTAKGLESIYAASVKKRTDYQDERYPCLLLKVTPPSKRSPRGTWTWSFRHPVDPDTGRRPSTKIGEYPALGLADARKEWERLKSGPEGLDGRIARLEQELADLKKKAGRGRKLKQLKDLYLEHADYQPGTLRNVESYWKNWIGPAFGDLDAETITPADIAGLKRRMAKAGIQTHSPLSIIRRIYQWAREEHLVTCVNPAIGIRASKRTKRERTLNDDEIVALWGLLVQREIPGEGMQKARKISPVVAHAILWTLLTGQRRAEVAGAMWREIHDDGWWRFAKRDRLRFTTTAPPKSKREVLVPITPMLEKVVEARRQARFHDDGLWLFSSTFPGRQDRHTEPQTLTLWVGRCSKYLVDPGEERFTEHDLRRTVRTNMARLGVDDTVAEVAVGHGVRGLQGVYNRYGYQPQLREAFELWHAHLEKIVTQANLPFPA